MEPNPDPWSFVDLGTVDPGPSGPDLAGLLRAVESLSADVAALRARPARVVEREALTPREAARALGVDRSRVLAPAIARGDVKAVKVNGGVRIPRSDVGRIAETGLPRADERRSRHRAAPRARSDVASRIRAISLDDL
jgi:excisionase family DNA binding protein